jgi:hypothetical protein
MGILSAYQLTGGVGMMNRAESIKRQIDILSPSLLAEVDRFILRLSRKAEKQKPVPKSLLSDLAEYAIASDDLPTDLAEQHEHYLYGLPRK